MSEEPPEEELTGRGDSPAKATVEIQRSTIVVALCGLAVAIVLGVASFMVGKNTGADLDSSQAAGLAAGKEAGTARGTARGFASGVKAGHAKGYAKAFGPAYKQAYIARWKKAGLGAPKSNSIEIPK